MRSAGASRESLRATGHEVNGGGVNADIPLIIPRIVLQSAAVLMREEKWRLTEDPSLGVGIRAEGPVRLNTRGRYGLQLLSAAGRVIWTTRSRLASRTFAKTTGLPWRYLEQIAGPLRRASLIAGRPGRAGGYKLASRRRASRCASDGSPSGPLRLMDCVDKPDICDHSAKCASRAMWVNRTGELRGVLDRFTLDDLAQRPCAGARATAARRARAAAPPSGRPSRGRGASKRWKYMRSLE